MRFHLVDRIDHVEPWRAVRARKLTSRSEDHWVEGPDGAVMPPHLVLEALCQAGTWLMVISSGRRRRAALLSVEEVTFPGAVRPGDVVDLEGWVDSAADRTAVLSGRAAVDGRTVLEARHVMCALVDADDLAAPDDTERMARLLTRVEP